MSEWKKNPILVGIVASVTGAAIVSGATVFIAVYVQDAPMAAFLGTLLGLAILLIGYQVKIINPVQFFGGRLLVRHTGIKQVYESFHEAFPDLHKNFAKAEKRIDLLLYIGRREFGIKDALFSDLLREKLARETNLEVRILHIAEDSPYLSVRRARQLGKRQSKWLRDVRHVRSEIQEIAQDAQNVRVIAHKEPFLWRIFIFDNVMFVSSYLHATKNDQKAPVYLIEEGDSSLYTAFETYFDGLWRSYSTAQADDTPSREDPEL